MNCINCGGPMTLAEGRGHFVCEYCTSFHFPGEECLSDQGIKVLDARSEWSCPVCAHDLSVGLVEGEPLQVCPACRGVLARTDDFRRIVAGVRARHEGPNDGPRPLDPAEMARRLRCPQCGRVMEAHPYYGPGNIVVDSCRHCGLIWLDHGELGVIERAPGRR